MYHGRSEDQLRLVPAHLLTVYDRRRVVTVYVHTYPAGSRGQPLAMGEPPIMDSQ